MSDEQEGGEIGASVLAASSLPTFLRVQAQYGTIVCTEHRTAYTPTNISNHLVSSHHSSKLVRDQVQRHCQEQQVAAEVSEPPHDSAPIVGLQIYQGWQCTFHHCGELSQSAVVIGKHCSQVHGMNSKRRRDEIGVVVKVSMQKWFAKTNKYWIINHRRTTTTTPVPSAPPSSVYASSPPLLPTSPPSPIVATSPISTAPLAPPTDLLSQTLDAVLQDQQHVSQVYHEAEHPAELSPWQYRSGYHQHFLHVDMDLIHSALGIPRTALDHAHLFHMVQSVRRVLQTPYEGLRHLHPVVAKRLNSFEASRISQDPFTFLQNDQSWKRYTTTFQRLVCYFYRVGMDDHLDRPMFEVTPQQQSALESVISAVDALHASLGPEKHPDPAEPAGDAPPARDGEPRGPATASDQEPALEQASDDPELLRLQSTVDATMSSLLLALLLHDTRHDCFQSAVFSFCAAASWSHPQQRWIDENASAALLSQIIYCCQVVFLAEAERCRQLGDDFVAAVSQLCQTWLHNDAFGPLGDMVRLRSYAMKVAGQVVQNAPIRWRSDGETLMYRDLTYHISDLTREITFCLDQARLIFHRDLCLNLPDLPTFDLRELEDNWDDQAPGRSFLTDVRNSAIFHDHDRWLLRHIAASPSVYGLVIQHQSIHDTVGDQVRSTFAREYEASVQRFLGYLSILMHKGSGQPARMTEFLSLRWQNKWSGGVSRNLYVHDGFLLFVLTYHKSMHRTHASRYPVRLLLPEVAQLLVQYLVLVMPLRLVFARQVQIPPKVSEYLWHDGEKIWETLHFTKLGATVSLQAHGVAVNMSSWRQIAVAIAIRKFGGLDYQADLDMPTDGDDDLAGQSILDGWGGAMADVFHYQAAHTVRTGNQHYGGTVNFDRGLTDAGLHEYIKASRLWHLLCRPRPQPTSQQAGRRRHASHPPMATINPPLRQRLALRDRPSRHRLRWGSEQVHFALRQLFPHSATVQFRSVHQERLIEAIVTGCAEVVGVLATGEGKSLGFLLPACLPRAGLTVVIVPLVALKADMTRRCDEAGLSYSVWTHASDGAEFQGTPLLFVSVEQAVGSRFRAFLGQQDAIEMLDRVVIDEAHLILTAESYRPKMGIMRQLRQMHCQVVCLTATLPPLMQSQFEARLFLHQPRVIRSRSFRADITSRIRRSRDANLVAYTVRTVQSMLEHYHDHPSARLLVYTKTRAAADTLSEQLSCPKYYSDSGDVEEKRAATAAWRTGQSKVMVATSAFGLGVDFPSVRQVLHMDVPTDMINFAQEVGRLSRDGQGGFSRIIMPRNWQAPPLPSVVDQRRSAVSEMAMLVYLGENRCLSAVMSRFLDGAENIQYCTQSDAGFRCSPCARSGLFQAGQDQDSTPWWDPDSGHGHVLESSEDETPPISSRVGVAEISPVAEGSHRLRASMRETAMARDRYEQGLEMLRGRCMICMILGQKRLTVAAQQHELQVCRHIQRSQFLSVKKQAIARNKPRGGWMKPFVACYYCGQPQDICQVDPDHPGLQPGQRPPCRYGDMIFPATWALFQQERSWGRRLGDISGVASQIWQEEDRWMDWLGTECELYGMRACQGARMMDQIIQLELAHVFAAESA